MKCVSEFVVVCCRVREHVLSPEGLLHTYAGFEADGWIFRFARWEGDRGRGGGETRPISEYEVGFRVGRPRSRLQSAPRSEARQLRSSVSECLWRANQGQNLLVGAVGARDV